MAFVLYILIHYMKRLRPDMSKNFISLCKLEVSDHQVFSVLFVIALGPTCCWDQPERLCCAIISKNCCVPGCTHNKGKNPDWKCYTFPKEEQRRNKWLAAIKRPDLKSDESVDPNQSWFSKSAFNYVCSSHFDQVININEPIFAL